MENLTLNLNPLQLALGFAMEIWLMVIFPIIIICKINYLTALVEQQLQPEDENQAQ